MPPDRRRTTARIATLGPIVIFVALAVLSQPALAETGAEHGGTSLGARLPLWSIVPFAGILLSIAFFPLFVPRWWHNHFAKVSVGWAVVFAVPFIIAFNRDAIHEILHVYFLDYVPFIILLWSLFTIAGGIHIRGTLRGSPLQNVILLVIGTLIASWIGTTGASMVMIRPLLRANMWRRHKVHVVVFFIILVSNIGGALTPIGDPPLFLGFLNGVPFFWTMRLVVEMMFIVIPLLVVFIAIDVYYYRKETPPEDAEPVPIRVDGLHNLLFLAGVIVAVVVSGAWHPGKMSVLGVSIPIEFMTRETFLLILGGLSLLTTSKAIHKANGFNWFPIKEVAYLFAGIFMTIVPALAMLNAGSEGALAFIMEALKTPAHYFWITGSLSSFLDNAPSYLTFFNAALGNFYAGIPHAEAVPRLIAEQEAHLKAISVGAVFWGALTYIGNAPNFMVRSIAEEAGVKCPSFFGYMFKYSVPLLIPLFVIMTFVFF